MKVDEFEYLGSIFLDIIIVRNVIQETQVRGLGTYIF